MDKACGQGFVLSDLVKEVREKFIGQSLVNESDPIRKNQISRCGMLMSIKAQDKIQRMTGVVLGEK